MSIESVCQCILEIDSFSDVYMYCESVPAKWHILATYLKIHKPTVDAIDSSEKDVMRCLDKIISAWLRRSSPTQPKPSWKTLSVALGHIGEVALSERIQKDHPCGCGKGGTRNVAVIVRSTATGVIVFIKIVTVIIMVSVLMIFVLKYTESGSYVALSIGTIFNSEPGTCKNSQCHNNTNSNEGLDHELDLDESRIWTNGEKGDDVVHKCIEKLQSLVPGVFPDDKGLMRRIAHVMTNNGTCPLKNIHNDGGIWQVSLHAFKDSQAVNDHSRLRSKYNAISRILGIKDWLGVVKADMEKPMYSLLAARLYLSNFPHTIPMERDIKGQQDYWWSVYMDKHEARQFMNETAFEEALKHNPS